MLSLYDRFPEDFDPSVMPFMVEIDGLEVPLWCERFERRGVSGATAVFADFDSERRAGELVGREFRVEHPRAEAGDEFYLEDLVGFAAEVSVAGATVSRDGRIVDFYDHDANPLFELGIDGRRVLVPAVEEFITRVDFDERKISLELPEGLLELG